MRGCEGTERAAGVGQAPCLDLRRVTAAITDSNPPGQFFCPTCEKYFEIGDRCPTDGTRLVRINVPVDPLLGRELDGRYRVVQKLGQGGMGAVYRGAQLGLGREVAIKVISAHLVTEPDVVKRFLREAKLASRHSHPNAVAVLDFNQTQDGLFYLVMELVSGRTLDKVFEEEHALRAERIIRIGSQVCDALEGAHALQIVHRDLKPSNIMILARGRDLVKVLDFGLAKSVAPDQPPTTMTNAGALLASLGGAPVRRRWAMPATVTVVVLAGGAALLAINNGGAKQPAGGTGSASAAGSAAIGSAATAGSGAGEIEMTRVPPPPPPPVVEVGSASTSTQTGSPTPTPTPKHHHDNPVVPHGDKTVPHTVDKDVKPEGPKPPDPGTSNGSALPF